MDRLECFNEKNGGKIKRVVRKLEHKLIHREDPELLSTQSDYGPELVISIPFDGECAIKSICIIGAGEGRCPTRMRLYKNETAVDADICENKKPIQEIQMDENWDGAIDWPVNMSKWNNTQNIVIGLDENHGGNCTKI